MIGIVVVAHGNIGCEMVAATKRILPELAQMCAVAVESNDPPESIRQQIDEALRGVDSGEGVLILTDMFGGTPSNVCLSFLEPAKVEVVSGFNLPMLIKLATHRATASVPELVRFIQLYGQRNIVIASEVLARAPQR
jgi:PTS system mannose-specific IIA component